MSPNDRIRLDRLTWRELEVINGIAEGKTMKEIAIELNLSYSTITTHVDRISRKIGLAEKLRIAAITKFALRVGIACVVGVAMVANATTYTNIVNPPSTVALAWDVAPNTNYVVNLYTGIQSHTYTNQTIVGKTNFVVVPIVRGVKYYFAITYTYAGLESDFSSEVTYINTNTIPNAPIGFLPPVLLQVQYKNNLQDFLWVDSGMSWVVDPREANQYFRLNLVSQVSTH